MMALVLGVVSCQTEPEGFDVIVGGEQEAVINVSLAEATRTSADSGIVNVDNNVYDLRYILEVYDTAGNTFVYRDVQTVATNVKTVSFPVRLIPEREYNFVVWADFVTNDSENDRYYTTTNGLDEVSIIPSMWVQMDEARDAYTGHETVTGYNSGKSINITLTRPFGKLRVITTDIDALNELSGKPMPESIEVTYSNKVYTAFNALIQKPIPESESSKSYAYVLNNVYGEDWTTENRTLFTDYIFGTASGSIQFTMDVKMTNDNVVSNNFNTEIPVKRNYLTTITGDILTDGNNIKVDVSDDFENAGGTDPDYEHSTISSDAEFLAALNADGKFIVISDLHIKDNVITPGLLSTRAGEATGNVSTINLNGYTITVENKTDVALATVNAGNTLFLESGRGGGKIVLAEGSKASFIENNGNVILTSGEIKNESTEAPVVAGTIVVNNGAVLNDDEVAEANIITVSEKNDGWLANVLENGGTYVFTADMRADQIKITATAPVVLDGNGYTFTYTGTDRAIEIPSNATEADVTIKNLNIAFGASYCQRGINFNVTNGTLTIDNVKVSSENGGYATYAINLPGSSDNSTVTINNSYLRGNIALNVWGENMTINATNTEFVSADDAEVENYAAISVNNDGAGNCAEGTIVDITGGRIVALDEDGNNSYAVRNSTMTGVVDISESTEVIGTISNPVVAVIYEGYNEFYTFLTLQEAIDKVCEDNNGSVRLIKDIELSETATIPAEETIVIDLNGHKITTPWEDETAQKHYYAFENHGTFTIQDSKGNGEIIARGIFNYGTMTLKSGKINACDGNGGYGVRNYEGAEFIMNGGSIITSLEDGDTPGNGYDACPVRVDEGATATFNGGIINNISNFTVAIDNYGTTTINDGTFTTIHTTIANSNTMTINGGSFTCNGLEGVTAHAFWAAEGTATINGGTFDGKDNYNGFNVDASKGAVVNIKGGEFLPVHSGSLYGEGTIIVTGGEFFDNPSKRVAEGYAAIKKDDNTYTVIPTVLKDGDVLDLGGAEYNGTITVEGNVTIKGDTEIKTLKSTTGCTITIEDGKTLTLNNFSFGAPENADAKYEIKGGTVTANYGFFQHGKYTLRSNFETGYMYYSYGSDITVYGTFHSQGKGDGLDYVRGKLTIAKGGKSIHDKSLWVGQPASWGAMNASLVIEDGGYVQVNSLSVYEGSSLTYSNDADLKYNSVTGKEYITKE